MNKLFLLITLIVFPAIFADDNFSSRGCKEFGGTIIFAFSAGNYEKNILIGLNPIVRFFPCKLFYIGPGINFDYTRYEIDAAPYADMIDGIRSTYNFGIGPDIGLAFSNNSVIIPFVGLSPQYLYSFEKNKAEHLPVNKNTGFGFAVPIYGGLKIIVQKSIGINFEGRYKYSRIDKTNYNFGSFGIGISILLYSVESQIISVFSPS